MSIVCASGYVWCCLCSCGVYVYVVCVFVYGFVFGLCVYRSVYVYGSVSEFCCGVMFSVLIWFGCWFVICVYCCGVICWCMLLCVLLRWVCCVMVCSCG